MKKTIRVIMIISLLLICCTGCMKTNIYNNDENIANNTNNTNNIVNSLEIQSSNAQFEQYTGTKIRGTVARNLIYKVRANNNTDLTTISVELKGLTKTIDFTSESDKLTEMSELIEIGEARYDIEIAEYAKDGSVSKITITQTAAGTSENTTVSGD